MFLIDFYYMYTLFYILELANTNIQPTSIHLLQQLKILVFELIKCINYMIPSFPLNYYDDDDDDVRNSR